MAYNIYLEPLTPEIARDGTETAALLPLLESISPDLATTDYLLADAKPDGTPLHGKWQHSYVLRDGQHNTAGLMVAYEKHGIPGAIDPLLRPELHLSALAVANNEQHRRRGLGSAMLRFLTDSAFDARYTSTDQPIRHLGLKVSANNTPALQLYRRFGFAAVGYETTETGSTYNMQTRVSGALTSQGYACAVSSLGQLKLAATIKT